MTDNNKNYISTQLSLSSYLNKEERKYYEKLHQTLPKMEKNQVNIVGIDIKKDNPNRIVVTAFVRSTVEKPINIKPKSIILLDKNLEIFAKKKEDFTNMGTMFPNTSKPLVIEFLKDHLELVDLNQLTSWSLAFKKNVEHRIDFSDLDKEVSETTKVKLNELAQKESLEENELSLMGFSAKRDESNNLLLILLIRNGTKKNLKIKQLPLKFYDATGELSAQGTFKIEDMIVLANTSKPITLVFPFSSIIKKDLDLSEWSVVHNE